MCITHNDRDPICKKISSDPCRDSKKALRKQIFRRSNFPSPLLSADKVARGVLVLACRHFRVLGITYKSAWFLTHRIRECMRDGAPAGFGGDGGIVEVDETLIVKEPGVTKAKNACGGDHKMKMLTLVDRTTKRAKSIVIDDLKKIMLISILQVNSAKEAYLMTD